MEEEQADSASDTQAPVLEIADQPSREFLELFTKLDAGISGELIEKAWKQYDTTGQQIVLEGNQPVWMACAFFTTVLQSSPPVYSNQGQTQPESVCRYSLTKLLELCACSPLEFFDKLNKWADMCRCSRRLLDHIGRVQANAAVCAVIFKKFLPIFRHVFANVPAQQTTGRTPQKSSRSAVNPALKVDTAALFEFVWTFYIALRKQLPASQEDLLNSFHLLLCVIDFIYDSLVEAGMERHLSIQFATSLQINEQTALESLCEKFEAVTLDAKSMRAHWLLTKLRVLAQTQLLHGFGHEGGIMVLFNANRESFEQLYEQKMLVRSEVDERVFLKQPMANIGAMFEGQFDESAVSVLREFGENAQLIDTELLLKTSIQNCMEKLSSQKGAVQPPIAGKSYIITPETVCPNIALTTPVKQSEKLEQLLMEQNIGASEHILDYIFEECHENPRDQIAQQLLSFTKKLMAKIDEEMAGKSADYDAEFERGIAHHLHEIDSLFYYLLQKVLSYDRERAHSLGMEMNVDLGTIFQTPDFLASLYICATDLCLWAHDSRRQFPWAAELFADTVPPINYYRIFELVVRADTGLSREMVKHLNKVEERVLEELAWSAHSPLWAALQSARTGVEQHITEVSAVPGSQILATRTLQQPQQNRFGDLPLQLVAFFKKVYHLATIRVLDLCERVRIMDDLTRQKIWTLFEHVFRTQTALLKDRHLDQLLMCCVYIIAKVCNLGITFQDIMYNYRHQPQAEGRVYRKVLMDEGGGQPQRADLIQFYNRIFVPRTEDYVKLLHPSGPDSKENLVPLTPIPKIPLNPLSPRKLVTERVNVVPMSQYAQTAGSAARSRVGAGAQRYNFYKSPSKDLKNINAMISRGSGGGGGSGAGAAGPSSSSSHYY